MRKFFQAGIVSTLAAASLLSIATLNVHAQTATAPQCTLLHAKLQSQLVALGKTQRDLERLKAIIRNYDAQQSSSLLPSSGIVARLDTVDERAREHALRIDELTQLAGLYRKEIKKCEGTA